MKVQVRGYEAKLFMRKNKDTNIDYNIRPVWQIVNCRSPQTFTP